MDPFNDPHAAAALRAIDADAIEARFVAEHRRLPEGDELLAAFTEALRERAEAGDPAAAALFKHSLELVARELLTEYAMEATYRAGDPYSPDALLPIGNGRYVKLEDATDEHWRLSGLERPDDDPRES